MNKPTVTAGQVRDYFNADPKRLAALSEDARKTVERVEGKSPRGRLAPEAVALHNKRRKVAYESGASNAAKAAAKEQAASLRAAAREAGFEVGSKGPLPKAFLATLKG